MSRRRARSQFHEPSLVPMADMLTNTVGVVLFILIFTVLTAASGVLTKHLPMEHSTKAEQVEFLCAFGRIAPVDFGPLIKEFLRPMGRTVTNEFVAQFKNRKLETEYFVLTGEAVRGLIVIIQPKPGNGESTADLALSSSKYRSILAGLNPQEKYTKFMIYPNGVSTFRAAREIASSGAFGTGWDLYGADERIRICVGFCGSGYGGPGVVK